MRGLLALVLLVLLAGCTEPATGPGPSSSSASPDSSTAPAVDCRGHRHATFAVFTPGADGPHRLNMSAPKDASGRAYYQLGIAPKMTVAVHMHQSGAEQGSAELGASQMHYESPGACASIADSLAVIDVTASEAGLNVSGRHGTVGQAGDWSSNATAKVHLYTRPADETCAWTERPISALDETVAEGLSFLVAFGTFSPDQVTAMKAAVPRPMGHEACE